MEIPAIETIGIYTAGGALLAMALYWLYSTATRERTRVTKQDREDIKEREDLRARLTAQEGRMFAMAKEIAAAETRGAACEERSNGQAREISRLVIELQAVQARNTARDEEVRREGQTKP